MRKILKKDFYDGATEEVAQKLLGKILCRQTTSGLCAGRIVETEAYLGKMDLACHAARGKTKRTEVMFGPAGRAYVYLIYGMYYCLNIVTQEKGTPEAVLIRALEPIVLHGEKIKSGQKFFRDKKIEQILNGPGKLCREFEIGKEQNGAVLSRRNGLWVEEEKNILPATIVMDKRIGVDYAEDWKNKPLRFYIKNNPFVSKK